MPKGDLLQQTLARAGLSPFRFVLDTAQQQRIAALFKGKSVLVTGGTGSFGTAFVRELIRLAAPARVAVFSRDELKQHEMQQRPELQSRPEMRYLIGDVRDRDRVELACRDVDIIIHAAALKQVPTAEYNPFECIRTNVVGAENVVQAALRNDVKKVIALSTDKAANPINLYGASKLASDKIFVAANNMSGNRDIRFAVVRYGNVIGSRGSVLPLFRKLVAEGAKELPITDARMTRFWISLGMGVQFVMSCLDMMRGGEIFVPKIPSMKLTDMAEALAPGTKQREIGIRPGEKLHEIMISEDDARTTLELPDRYIIEPAFHWWRRDSYLGDGAKEVPEGFRYASDTNSDWLSKGQLLDLMQQVILD